MMFISPALLKDDSAFDSNEVGIIGQKPAEGVFREYFFIFLGIPFAIFFHDYEYKNKRKKIWYKSKKNQLSGKNLYGPI